MLTYTPGGTIAHRLDARAKLAVQFGFAVAAFAHPTPAWIAALAVIAAGILVAARLSPLAVLRGYWFVFVILLFGPVTAMVRLGPPWIDPAAAIPPALAVSRVALVILVGAAYVRTTPVRETRAAIQRHVPGKLGQTLGVGVGLTFRFLPVLRRDLLAVRTAMDARLGSRRSVVDRIRRIGVHGVGRAFQRADHLSLALRARCFAWNPTPPAMTFGWADAVALALGVALALAPLVPVVLART